jgi:hypothetical protein
MPIAETINHNRARMAFNRMAMSVGILAQAGPLDENARAQALGHVVDCFKSMPDDENNGLLWREAAMIARHVPDAAPLPFLFLDKMTRNGQINAVDMHEYAEAHFDALAGKKILSMSGRFYMGGVCRVDNVVLVPVAMRGDDGHLAFVAGTFYDNARSLLRAGRGDLDGFDSHQFVLDAQNALRPL